MEIEESDMVMEKRIAELEVECDHLKDEKIKLEMEVKCDKEKMKEKVVRLKEKLSSEERKWKEKYMVEVQKRKLEIDLKAAVSKRTSGDLKAVVECLKKSLEERDNRIEYLLGENEVLEKPNNRSEMDFNTNMAVEAKRQNLELSQKVEALEQMRAVEAKKQKLGEETILELNKRIESLEEEKREIEAKAMVLNAEIEKEKIAAKSEKTAFKEEIMKLNKRIRVLWEEKEEKEAKVSLEKNAEIQRISIENMALKEKEEEMRKEWADRDDVIKVLRQEIETLKWSNVAAAAQKNQGRSLNETSKRMNKRIRVQKRRD